LVEANNSPQDLQTMSQEPELLLTASRFRVVRQAQIAPDGSIHWRETVQHPGSVAIVPLVDDEHVCLIRNFRVAVGQTLWELPAGTLDHDEPPLATAGRELIEETGYRAAKIEKLTELSMSPGILNERMHVYLATGLTLGPDALEPGEEITTKVVPWTEALAMIERGEIHDAKTIAGLLFFDRFQRRATQEREKS
jgi:ADP-ribose pyrophosphatase